MKAGGVGEKNEKRNVKSDKSSRQGRRNKKEGNYNNALHSNKNLDMFFIILLKL